MHFLEGHQIASAVRRAGAYWYRVLRLTVVLSLPPPVAWFMKAWTTEIQLAWLKGKLPEWHQAHSEKRVRGFLDNTIIRFYEKFSVPASEQVVHDTVSCLSNLPVPTTLTWTQWIRKWFYNHGKLSNPQPVPTAPSIDFVKTQRKVVPLTLSQAYSLFYCTRDSALYVELIQDWKLYASGDTTAFEKYQHLFATKPNRKLPFVTFQQTVLRDRVTTLSEEQRAALQEFIDSRFQRETDHREHPWRALKVDDDQLDVDLERQYVKG
jgi:hypothetical protein